MAKKYLLYIHDNERFDKELYKSELVNRLLAGHWLKNEPGDYVAPIEDIEELKADPIEETEEYDDYQAEIEARLVPVPGQPNAATDPVDEVTYKVKRVNGRLRIVE